MNRFFSAAALLLTVLNAQFASAAEPLRLSDVLQSALQHHPKVNMATSKIDVAEAATMQADGAFDFKLYASGQYSPIGKYNQPRGEVGFKQPTTFLGAEFFGKYGNGADFAPYDGDMVTSEAGKASLGVLVPLAQGRAIDSQRFEVYRAQLELTIAEEQMRNERAEILAKAAATWWKWAVTGQKLLVYQKLIAQTEARQTFLTEQVKAGAIAPIEAVDNGRLVAQRKADLASQTWQFRRLSLEMGLYRRGPDGQPLPSDFGEIPSLSTTAAVQTRHLQDAIKALENSPAAKIYRTTLEIIEREVSLAENGRLPRMDLEIYAARGFGQERPYSVHDSSYSGTSAGLSLTMQFDVQRRKARGKAAVLRAKKRVVEQELRLLLDSLHVEAQASFAALAAQHEAARLSAEAMNLASQVASAELESFELGQGSVLSLNLREYAALAAQISELESSLAFQLSWIELQRIAGKSDTSAYLPPVSGGEQ